MVLQNSRRFFIISSLYMKYRGQEGKGVVVMGSVHFVVYLNKTAAFLCEFIWGRRYRITSAWEDINIPDFVFIKKSLTISEKKMKWDLL